MNAPRTRFTLWELLLLCFVTALLFALLMPVRSCLFHNGIHLDHVILNQLSFAVDEYHRVYGAYPHDTMWWTGSSLTSGDRDCEPDQAQGYDSLYLALQGPDGKGWGPTAAAPGIRQFGPIPESPGFVRTNSLTGRPHFVSPAGRPVLYYKARLASPYPDIAQDRPEMDTRYLYPVCRKAWENPASQRGANEKGSTSHFILDGTGPAARRHWTLRLTNTRDEEGTPFPCNPRAYLLWSAGEDGRFGYWSWSRTYGGYVADPDPSDPTDGVEGACDDVTNF